MMKVELTEEEVHFLSEIMYFWHGSFGESAKHSKKIYRNVATKLGVVEKLKDLDAWK